METLPLMTSVLVRYVPLDGQGPDPTYHERVVIGNIGDGRYFVVTPDFELFPMILACPPLRNLVVLEANRDYPLNLRPEDCYMAGEDGENGFFTAAQREELLRHGRDLVRVERGRLGLDVAGAAPAGAPAPHWPAWVLAEPVGEHLVGERVLHRAGDPTDARDALVLVDGARVHARRVESQDELNALCETVISRCRSARAMGGNDVEVGEDERTLSVVLHGDSRYRAFQDAVGHMHETTFSDFPISGPRTLLWLLREVSKTGSGPRARHHRWVIEASVGVGDRSRYEHEVLSEILELACTYDCLNAPNIGALELVGRRLQLIEEAHSSSPGAPCYDGSEHFMGTQLKPGGALVAPMLANHVMEKLKMESGIAKERRTADEVRQLRKPGHQGERRRGGGASQPKAAPPEGA